MTRKSSDTSVIKWMKMLLCLIAAAALLPANTTAASNAARIDIARGKLTVERPGVEKPFTAWAGSDINIGDIITAGDRAEARLSFTDNSFVNMTGQTSIRVNQYVYEPEKYAPDKKRALAIVRVLNGRARFVANIDPNVDYQIYVETGTAAVSGGSADFVVTALPDETWIAALNGGVSVTNVLKTTVGMVTLYPNQKTVVRGKKPPEKPVFIPQAERKALVKETIVR